MWGILQQTLGIQFMVSNGQPGVQIKIPKKGLGGLGLLSNMYIKLEKLWKVYEDKKIITPGVN